MNTFLFGLLFLLTGASTYAQLDSVEVNSAFTTNPSITEGLDSAALLFSVLQVKVHVNDVDYVGKIAVLIYDASSETPLAMVKYTRSEILAGSMMEDGWIVFNFGNLDPEGSYRIVTEAQNFQLAYLEPVVIYEPAN